METRKMWYEVINPWDSGDARLWKEMGRRGAMSVSRKHYNAIAKVLDESPIDDGDKCMLANRVADVFEQDNEHFDRARFVSAVMVHNDYGYEEWREKNGHA